MTFIQHYNSLLGGILLAVDEIGLTGLWFDGEKYYADNQKNKDLKECPPRQWSVRLDTMKFQ